MKSAVIVFPGSNRDADMISALRLITGREPVPVWHRDTEMPDVDLIVLPGGFSYGDYLRSGAIAARSPILKEVKAKAEAGVHVLGVCNGFQILTEAGLLPGVLMRNAGLKFVCKEIHLRVANSNTAFSSSYEADQVIRCPIAHHDGNYFAESEILDRLEGEGRVVFRYAGPAGANDGGYNPNGSQRDIAGILNDKGNVLGMMPHPENLVEPLHGGLDGRGLFESLMNRLG